MKKVVLRVNYWEGFNQLTTKMVQLIYINFLWLFFTLVGLGVFGLFPATTAMFTVIRKIHLREDIKISRVFWQSYKSEFLKANRFAAVIVLFLLILYVDFYFVIQVGGPLEWLFPVFVFLLIAAAVVIAFFFPVYVHFNLKFLQYFKQAFFIGMKSPLELFAMGVILVCMYGVYNVFPGAIPLFAGSIFAYVMTALSIRAFNRIERKKGGAATE